MNDELLKYLICPACLPAEHFIDCTVEEKQGNDITTGTLTCPDCNAQFPIVDGIAFLNPADRPEEVEQKNYHQENIVSSCLWSHYGDLLKDDDWSDAYPRWSRQIQATSGLGLDIGSAVGRFTFELAGKCDFAIGLDKSAAFIRSARKLMRDRKISVCLKEEGYLHRTETIHLPLSWKTENMDFIVADSMRLPFRTYITSIAASLNQISKLPHPLQHLQEMNRICRKQNVQWLLADPFSWSEEVTAPDEWLGGRKEGSFTGFGLDTIKEIINRGTHGITPPWRNEKELDIWWKIRSHRNHFELIRSRCLKARR